MSQYVEFQSSFRTLLKYHRGAMRANRSFWRLLLSREIKMSTLLSSLSAIKSKVQKADLNYRAVLVRYPKSSKLLRAYGKFLADMKNDPTTAQKYYTEAEKLEEATTIQAKDNVMMPGTSMGATWGLHGIDESLDAAVVINPEGIIKFANRLACKVLGYKKGELEGKTATISIGDSSLG